MLKVMNLTGATGKEFEKMSKRDELIAKYAADLTNKCKMTPDMALLTKVDRLRPCDLQCRQLDRGWHRSFGT